MTIGIPSQLGKYLSRLGFTRQAVEAAVSVERYVTTLWNYQASGNMMSREGLEGVIRALVLWVISGALAELGDFGAAIEKLFKTPELIRKALIHELAYVSGLTTEKLSAAVMNPAIPLSQLSFDLDIESAVEFFLTGRLIGGQANTHGIGPGAEIR